MNTNQHTTAEGAGSSVKKCEKHHWQNAFPGDNSCPYCPAPLVLTLPAKPAEQWEAARVANEPKVDAAEIYYYRPLSFYGGKRLKCAGHGAEREDHRAFYVPYFDSAQGCKAGSGCGYLPGVMLLRGHHGDQVTLDYAYANQYSI